MMHTSAMVPPCGPAGTSRAIPQRIAGTLVGQEHAPTETSRPLSTGPDPCGRLQSFGAARPLLRLSLAFGPTVLGHTYIPRLESEGPFGTRFAMGLNRNPLQLRIGVRPIPFFFFCHFSFFIFLFSFFAFFRFFFVFHFSVFFSLFSLPWC